MLLPAALMNKELAFDGRFCDRRSVAVCSCKGRQNRSHGEGLRRNIHYWEEFLGAAFVHESCCLSLFKGGIAGTFFREVMIVAEFVTVPAFRHLGVQIVLLAMLSGMLAGGMAFDCASGYLTATDVFCVTSSDVLSSSKRTNS